MPPSSPSYMKNTQKDGKKKPKRPISGYIIFYCLAREYMYASLSQNQNEIDFSSVFRRISNLDNDKLMKKSLDIQMNYRTEQSGKDTTMKKLKSRLGLIDMTRIISTQWSKLSPSKKAIFEECSDHDRKMYFKMRDSWRSQKDAKIKERLEKQALIDQDSDLTLRSRNNGLKTDHNYDCSYHVVPGKCIGSTLTQTQHNVIFNPPRETLSCLNQMQMRNQMDIVGDRINASSTRKGNTPVDTCSYNLLQRKKSLCEFNELMRQRLLNYAHHRNLEMDLILTRNGHTPVDPNTLSI